LTGKNEENGLIIEKHVVKHINLCTKFATYL